MQVRQGLITELFLLTSLPWCVAGGKRARSAWQVDDTACSLREDSWYDALQDITQVDSFVDSWQGTRIFHLMDLFGASASAAAAWTRFGYAAVACDILLGREIYDITAKDGFYTTLSVACSVLSGGICVAGPPCSMFTFLASSVHRRTKGNPNGDLSNMKVRLSNLIVRNTVAIMQALVRRNVFIVIEQPSNSVMFHLPCMKEWIVKLGLVVVMTFMAAFGHDMPKPTHLLGNLPGLALMRRVRPRKNLAAASGMVYHYKNKHGQSCGGKDLHKSAAYTLEFTKALCIVWEKEWFRHEAKRHASCKPAS